MLFSRLVSFPHAFTDVSLTIAIGEYISLVESVDVSSLIKIKKSIISGFNHYTITLKVPKGKFEDEVYGKNPTLLDIVPRAYTIITSGPCSDEKIVSFITGPSNDADRLRVDPDILGTYYNHHTTQFFHGISKK